MAVAWAPAVGAVARAAPLRDGRSADDHLAGRLGVAVDDAMEPRRARCTRGDDAFVLTDAGTVRGRRWDRRGGAARRGPSPGTASTAASAGRIWPARWVPPWPSASSTAAHPARSRQPRRGPERGRPRCPGPDLTAGDAGGGDRRLSTGAGSAKTPLMPAAMAKISIQPARRRIADVGECPAPGRWMRLLRRALCRVGSAAPGRCLPIAATAAASPARPIPSMPASSARRWAGAARPRGASNPRPAPSAASAAAAEPPLAYEGERWPGEANVGVTTLDDPAPGHRGAMSMWSREADPLAPRRRPAALPHHGRRGRSDDGGRVALARRSPAAPGERAATSTVPSPMPNALRLALQ